MKGMVRVASAVAAVCALATGSALYAHAKPGDVAPPFGIETFTKDKISSDQLKGQVVILNFWATWCGPCRQELPELDRYSREHQQQGLRVFAVATEDSVPDYFLKPLSRALSFPLAHRIKGSAFGVIDGVPTSYVIDRKGVVRYAKAAAFDTQALDEIVGPLLAEPAPTATTASAAP